MIYIVILNWNSAVETIRCVNSLLTLNNFSACKVLVCDNKSEESSYNEILDYFKSNHAEQFIELLENEITLCNLDYKYYLIRNLCNYGYAGGNNIGIRLALNFDDMSHLWILNNDTIVEENSLNTMLLKMNSNADYQLVGSRLIQMENNLRVQGVGGVINPRFCTTKEIGTELNAYQKINELEYENQIDYVIGASLLISRLCLERVGLLCEDYFLYYEEIDYCNRVRSKGFKIGIASESLVFHEHGVSTGKGKSNIADYYSVRNRLLISKKFYSGYYIFTYLSLFLVLLNRLRRLELKKGINIMLIILNYKKDFK